MPKHFFFDLDNTLTRSKSHIAPEHEPILRALTEKADVIVVSGHDEGSIRNHLGANVGSYYILSQNGNHAEDPSGKLLWERRLTPEQVAASHEFIEKARKKLALKVKDENDLIDDRGCEVAYSLIGHHENLAIKEAFDPKGSKRRKLLEEMKEEVAKLEKHNVEIKIGGTTVLDFIEKGKNKGYNVAALVRHEGWRLGDCMYVGDALYPGGNDETVIGITPTKAVKDYRETYEYLTDVLSSSTS